MSEKTAVAKWDINCHQTKHQGSPTHWSVFTTYYFNMYHFQCTTWILSRNTLQPPSALKHASVINLFSAIIQHPIGKPQAFCWGNERHANSWVSIQLTNVSINSCLLTSLEERLHAWNFLLLATGAVTRNRKETQLLYVTNVFSWPLNSFFSRLSCIRWNQASCFPLFPLC